MVPWLKNGQSFLLSMDATEGLLHIKYVSNMGTLSMLSPLIGSTHLLSLERKFKAQRGQATCPISHC